MQRLLLAAVLAAFPALAAFAADGDYVVVIKDHRFEPPEIVVPAGRKFTLVVDNRDATPEEFESHALGREKVIAGMSRATIAIGPLKPGSYPFVGEYNEKTAKGVIVAR